MTLNITYEVTLKSDVILTDTSKVFSNNDSLQLTSKYSNNNIPNVSTKRLDIMLLPNPSINGDPDKEITIDLESLGVTSIKILHLKSLNNFYYKTGQSLTELNTINYERGKVIFKDYGDIVSPDNYTPPSPTPKFMRLMNPSNLNTGSEAITVSIIIITSHQ